VDFLRKSVLVELRNFGEPKSGTVAATTVLHRTPQATITREHFASRPRTRSINEDGIVFVFRPGAMKIVGHKYG
jgi:hypothetical protein